MSILIELYISGAVNSAETFRSEEGDRGKKTLFPILSMAVPLCAVF